MVCRTVGVNEGGLHEPHEQAARQRSCQAGLTTAVGCLVISANLADQQPVRSQQEPQQQQYSSGGGGGNTMEVAQQHGLLLVLC